MNVYYNNKDITNDVSVEKCIHDTYVEDQSDTLIVGFDNADGIITKWGLTPGDTIRVKEGHDDTGTLYVREIEAEGTQCIVYANQYKAKPARKRRAWQDTTTYQIISTVAKEYSLSIDTYNFKDHTYSYIYQDNETDLQFLNRILRYEGYSFLVAGSKLVIYSWQYLEDLSVGTALLELDPAATRLYDRPYYKSCRVTNGTISGRYVGSGSGGEVSVELREALESVDQAERFAKNILMHSNLDRKKGMTYSDELLTQIMAGTKLSVTGDYWKNKPVIITHVRHYFHDSKTKLWFRRCQNG